MDNYDTNLRDDMSESNLRDDNYNKTCEMLTMIHVNMIDDSYDTSMRDDNHDNCDSKPERW